MTAWSRSTTFVDRCNRLLREVIVGAYRAPEPFDYLEDEYQAGEAVYVWLFSIGLGHTPQSGHVLRYIKAVLDLREAQALPSSTKVKP
jgi:hypothetical protein